MKKIRDWEDAKHGLDLVFTLQHLKGMKPRRPDACIGHWAAVSLPNVVDCHVFQHVTFVKFKSGKILRYINDSTMTKVAVLNDRAHRDEIIKGFKTLLDKSRAIIAHLRPPTGVRRQSYLRSEAQKQARRETAERAAKRKATGGAPRKYTSPAMKGLRQGTGLAHSWECE